MLNLIDTEKSGGGNARCSSVKGLRLHQPDRLIARIRGLLLRPWAGWFLKPWLCNWSHSRGWTGCGTLIQWGALHRRLASNVWCRCWLRRRPSWRGFRLIGPYLICPSRSILSFRGGAGLPALLGGWFVTTALALDLTARIYGFGASAGSAGRLVSLGLFGLLERKRMGQPHFRPSSSCSHRP